MVWIAGDGVDQPGFYLDATEVTTAAFDAFVRATNYVTEAERFGWSGVFSPDSLAWLPVSGADYRHPLGPDAPPAQPKDPVTQISLADVQAYAAWAGKRLPSAAEWTYAASQGGTRPRFPWGQPMVLDSAAYPGNWWQGPFPYHDDVLDGYPGLAPVASFPPAPNGLYDVSGNVWEWTATRAADGQSVIKGGSFLCSTSYCTGFDLQQYQLTPADSGLNHLGFRLLREG